ncbi:T9SS type A sorting domain-containing protein [Hymenobacter sp. B81]|uniref:T9SS type A sorting domain-containing protein n=1 Tax=Hymenobacter sp. B81 TaxID=3344878 RepID=UPI0037DDA6CF
MLHSYSRFASRSAAALALLLSVGASVAQAQGPSPINLTATPYTENFDVMTAGGTTYPDGWTGIRLSGTGVANETLAPVISDGNSTSGAVYNVGTTNANDRALGSIASGSTVPVFGAVFSNQTGAAITQLFVAGRAEQWRSGSNNTQNEVLAFEYSLDATSLSTGTWTAVTNLNVTEPNNADVGGTALDGNLAINRAAFNSSITLNWPSNTTLWIRWKDANDFGTDAMLAVDDLTVSTSAIASARRNTAKANVSVFPTEVSTVLNVQVDGRNAKALVTISDLMGRKVLSTTAAEGRVNVSKLPAGSYVVVVGEGSEASTHKIIKR